MRTFRFVFGMFWGAVVYACYAISFAVMLAATAIALGVIRRA